MNSFFARRSQLIISQRIKTHLFKYFILFWHAIVFVAQKCWQVATNKKYSFSLLIFFYSKFWRHCAGPRPRPASVYTRVVKVSRLVLFSPVSSYWSDAKMWCTLFIQIGVPSQILTSHVPPLGVRNEIKKYSDNIPHVRNLTEHGATNDGDSCVGKYFQDENNNLLCPPHQRRMLTGQMYFLSQYKWRMESVTPPVLLKLNSMPA